MGKINFWNMSIFKNCAIASSTNASPCNKRPMIINALVTSNNSPNSRHRYLYYLHHSCTIDMI